MKLQTQQSMLVKNYKQTNIEIFGEEILRLLKFRLKKQETHPMN